MNNGPAATDRNPSRSNNGWPRIIRTSG